MKWIKKDYNGDKQVWYSEDVIKQIKEIAEKTLNYVDYKSYFKRDTVSFKHEAFKALKDIVDIIDK